MGQVSVEREDQPPLIARFGGQPIRREEDTIIKDDKARPMINTTELVRRLMANKCELCGSTADISVHHIRRLDDLKRRHASRRHPPDWVKWMIAIRRKTLVVYKSCHLSIHAGTYDGVDLKQGSLESRMNGNVQVRFGGGRLEKC